MHAAHGLTLLQTTSQHPLLSSINSYPPSFRHRHVGGRYAYGNSLHMLTGGTQAQQAAALASPLDILVATPQKLLQHAEKGNVFYGDIQYVVLDEADTMFDRGFGPEVESVLGPLRSKADPAQCILVAATLTKVGNMLATHHKHAWDVCPARSH